MGQRPFGVDLLGRHGRRHDELDVAVVQHVHQQRETPCGGRHVHVQLWHVRQQDGVELRGDFQVVVLRARTAAQLAEIEPDHAAGAALGGDLARLDLHHGSFVMRLGQAVEGVLHGGIGLGAQRAVIELGILQRAAAVVRAVVHVHDFHAFLEQRDRGQDAVAVQAVGIQAVGHEVGGGDEAHAVGEQGFEQLVENHGIRDVGDMELVEADELVLPGDLGAQRIERVLRALHQVQFAVHLAHELVKMQAHLAPERHGVEEALHQKALAAPHPAVHVDALGQIRVVDELLEGVGTLAFVDRPLVGAALQSLDSTQLRRVTFEALGLQLRLISLSYIHHRLQMLKKQ